MTTTLTISTLAVDTTTIDAADVTTVDNQLLTHLNNIIQGVQKADAIRFLEGSAPSAPTAASGEWKVYFTSAGPYVIDDTGSSSPLAAAVAPVCNARLTLTSGTDVTPTDVTTATHVYMTPCKGNRIALYNGTSWAMYTFSEIDINLSGFAANKNYDVFAYDNGSGTVIAETVVWTSDTLRATLLTTQDGVRVKTGTLTKRYIGTFRTTGTIGQCEDSILNRFVWNYNNRVDRQLKVTEATDSWTYTSATYRSWNNSTSNRVSFVRGLQEEAVKLDFMCVISMTAASAAIGIGFDSTTVFSGLAPQSTTTTNTALVASYADNPAEGFHFLQLLESGGVTATFRGDNGGTLMQSGAVGLLAA